MGLRTRPGIGANVIDIGGEIMKTVKCSESGMDCPFVARGDTDEEVLNIITDHALNVHGMSNAGDVRNQFRPLVRDE